MTELRGLQIARIRGVRLKIHVSLLFLLLYIMIVASAQFAVVTRQAGFQPNSISGGPLLWSLIFAIGLFISVAIHEFGHVFVAQALGVKVKGVTLMMLGGVSEMEQMPETKYSEFKLSIIGPLVSLALAAALFAVRRAPVPPEINLFAYWLGEVNLILGVFNLLPAFPLDGGRALRSLLAARQGILRATQNTVMVSKVFAWTLGVLGFLGFNLLLMLIAFFVYMAAQNELVVLASRDLLKGIVAGDVGIRTAIFDGNRTLNDAAEEMLRTRNRILPVHGLMGETGLVSLNELRTVPRNDWRTTPIAKIMSQPGKILDTHEPIAQILPELASSPAGALLMSENGTVVGIVRYADVTEVLQLRSIEASKKKAA